MSDSRVRYLVNRADSKGGLTRDDIAQLLGRTPDYEVVSDGILVLEANNRGQPFVTVGPEAQVAKDVSAIARRLMAELAAGQATAGAHTGADN